MQACYVTEAECILKGRMHISLSLLLVSVFQYTKHHFEQRNVNNRPIQTRIRYIDHFCASISTEATEVLSRSNSCVLCFRLSPSCLSLSLQSLELGVSPAPYELRPPLSSGWDAANHPRRMDSLSSQVDSQMLTLD
jgi:hypothetical protein